MICHVLRTYSQWGLFTMGQVTPFMLAIVDNDHKTYSVEGPMTDDTPWNSAVCRAQDEGRQVRCCTVPLGHDVGDELGRRMEKVPSGSIVRP